jgi:hypothetical protein
MVTTVPVVGVIAVSLALAFTAYAEYLPEGVTDRGSGGIETEVWE